MLRMLRAISAAGLLCLTASAALAQSTPEQIYPALYGGLQPWQSGFIPTVAQWDALFGYKQDVLTFPLAVAKGGTGVATLPALGAELGLGGLATVSPGPGVATATGFGVNAPGGLPTVPVQPSAMAYTPAHAGPNSDITALTGMTTPLAVSEGGTGVQTLTAGAPVLGGTTFSSGSRSGNTTQFATVGSGSYTAGHLAVWDANGNIVDGGAAIAGSGAVSPAVAGQLAGYATTGATVSGLNTGLGVLAALGVTPNNAGGFITAGSSGTLQAAQEPARPSGDCTNSAGSLTLTCQSTGGVAFGSLATASSINNSNWSGTPLAIANGGTGQSTAPVVTAGPNIAINGTWPNLTVGVTGFGANVGAALAAPANATGGILTYGTAIPSSMLGGYATQSWVNGMGYQTAAGSVNYSTYSGHWENSGGTPMTMIWSGQGQLNYLVMSNDGANFYPVAPASLNVNYANSTNYANSAGYAASAGSAPQHSYYIATGIGCPSGGSLTSTAAASPYGISLCVQ